MLPVLLLFFLAAPDAVTLFQERQFAAAESQFRQLLARRPGDARVRLYLARTLIELDRVAEALAEIDRALNASADPEIRFQAGKIIRDLAERRYSALERIAPDSAASLEMAGRRYELEGNLAEALRAYRAAMAKEPARPGLHYEAGNILWRQRQLDEAAAELREELALTPHHGMANLRLGQVLLAQTDESHAVPYLEHAVQSLPESVEARRDLGKAYRKAGRLAEARTLWESVAKARPQDDQIHYLLGTLYRQLGETDLAQRELAAHRAILERRNKRE